MKGGVAGYFQKVFEDKFDVTAEMSKMNIILVNKSKVSRYVLVDSIDLHVRGCGEKGQFVSHKPTWEYKHFVEGQPIYWARRFLIIAKICVPMVYTNNCLCWGLDRYSSHSRDLYYAVKTKLDSAAFE